MAKCCERDHNEDGNCDRHPASVGAFTDADRYKHGVIAVCSDLHSTHTGTLDGMLLAQYDEQVAWLRWRIDEGWRIEAPRAWLPQLRETEDAIRAFARRVLADSLVWRAKA